VIDTLLNLLFRCSHRRLTHPVAPIANVGKQHSQAYVVCLDCGKPFEYDMVGMRIGKLIDDSHDVSVVPKNTALPLATKVKYAILAAVPVALMIGAVVKVKKAGTKKGARTDDARDKGKTGAQE
jgi:DNA-directed RNA polymerase subunit RPC12/RpoP